jgi:ubiquinone/menaquinone biosynthesis C-methylase UbiE
VKIRDSGMPAEEAWTRFFSPLDTLDRLGLESRHADVLDLGCGYGTFSVAAAKRCSGTVFAIDIEKEMIQATLENALRLRVRNLRAIERDFLAQGTGLPEHSIDYAMLFNILHAERPLDLLTEVHRVLRPGGTVAIMHWIFDEKTPRGPPLNIRPRPEQCVAWLKESGFERQSPIIELPPYHFGVFAHQSTS